MDSLDYEDSQLVTINDLDYEEKSISHNAFRFPPHPIIYTGLRYIWGPLHILVDYSEIIIIALLARLITSLLDLTSFSSKTTLKNAALVLLGVYQIDHYLKRSCPELPYNAVRGVIYTIALTYASYLAVTNRFQTLLARAHIRNRTMICMISLYFVALAPTLYNEYRISLGGTNKQYSFLRSIYMSMTMKLMSLTSVVDRYKSPLALLAYILHPASTIMGVWHPYETDNTPGRDLSRTNSKYSATMFRPAIQLCKVLFILLISANISELSEYIDSTTLPQTFKTISSIYLVALEFRLSHYFSCYLAGTFLGTFSYNGTEHEQFCDVISVEWPRSLVDVVTKWNIPMHCWLKRYIFKRVLRHSNVELAIAATYLVSSMLHGFKFHIWSVLLTLGYLTWSEYHLRNKLARHMRACVEAQPCRYKRSLRTGKQKCTRGHTWNANNSLMVVLINFAFRLAAIAQLAYLGYIFVGNTDEATSAEAIQRWSSLYFFGHWLGFASFVGSTLL